MARLKENYSGADIEHVCLEAKDLAREDAISKYKDDKGIKKKVKEELENPLPRKYFERALQSVGPSEVIKRYVEEKQREKAKIVRMYG